MLQTPSITYHNTFDHDNSNFKLTTSAWTDLWCFNFLSIHKIYAAVHYNVFASCFRHELVPPHHRVVVIILGTQ